MTIVLNLCFKKLLELDGRSRDKLLAKEKDEGCASQILSDLPEFIGRSQDKVVVPARLKLMDISKNLDSADLALCTTYSEFGTASVKPF